MIYRLARCRMLFLPLRNLGRVIRHEAMFPKKVRLMESEKERTMGLRLKG